MPERCGNCGRPLRPWLRGFCARCVTTPAQRARLAQSEGAISNEGPLGRALDIAGVAVLVAVAIAIVVVMTAWLGVKLGLVTLVVVVILGALGLLGVAG
jgi:hypothetical protein